MRAWLFDKLATDPALTQLLGGVEEAATRIVPRQSRKTLPPALEGKRPFLVFGLGNSTAEQLMDSTDPRAVDAERQFFQVWIHDEGGSFVRIDQMVPLVKKALVGGHDSVSNLMTVIYLETSQEFNNETYGTIFRYIRFQAILAKSGAPA
jgi:hypothetical protein